MPTSITRCEPTAKEGARHWIDGQHFNLADSDDFFIFSQIAFEILIGMPFQKSIANAYHSCTDNGHPYQFEKQ